MGSSDGEVMSRARPTTDIDHPRRLRARRLSLMRGTRIMIARVKKDRQASSQSLTYWRLNRKAVSRYWERQISSSAKARCIFAPMEVKHD